jgi:hypothetical protein
MPDPITMDAAAPVADPAGDPAGAAPGVPATDKPVDQMTPEELLAHLEATPAGGKYIRDLKSAISNQSLETWKKNNLQKVIDAEIAKRFPPETPQDKEIMELRDRLGQVEREKIEEKLTNALLKGLGERGLPAELSDYFKPGTVDEIPDQLNNFTRIFKKAVDLQVEARIKGQPLAPQGGGQVSAPEGQITREQLESMSPADIVKLHDAGKLSHLTKKKE